MEEKPPPQVELTKPKGSGEVATLVLFVVIGVPLGYYLLLKLFAHFVPARLM
jgi:hypothetical protein